MARGVDKEKDGSVPPRRNPFRTKIKSPEEIKREKKARKTITVGEEEERLLKKQKEAEAAAREEAPRQAPNPGSLPTGADPGRVSLLAGLPLSIIDPLSGSQGFEYILDPDKAESLARIPLRSGLELVSWREEARSDIDPLSEQVGILYREEEPIALLTYDDVEEAYVLYAQEPHSGSAQALFAFSTTKRGLFGRIKKKSSYQQNPQRALAQDIHDFIEDIERGQGLLDDPFSGSEPALYGAAAIAAGVVLSSSTLLPHDKYK